MLAIGATLYGSAPFYAPADKDGTILLAPGQEGYYALGEAWGALRYEDYALLKGYRQLVDQGYINPSDIRMTPYTFEGVTVGGEGGRRPVPRRLPLEDQAAERRTHSSAWPSRPARRGATAGSD